MHFVRGAQQQTVRWDEIEFVVVDPPTGGWTARSRDVDYHPTHYQIDEAGYVFIRRQLMDAQVLGSTQAMILALENRSSQTRVGA